MSNEQSDTAVLLRYTAVPRSTPLYHEPLFSLVAFFGHKTAIHKFRLATGRVNLFLPMQAVISNVVIVNVFLLTSVFFTSVTVTVFARVVCNFGLNWPTFCWQTDIKLVRKLWRCTPLCYKAVCAVSPHYLNMILNHLSNIILYAVYSTFFILTNLIIVDFSDFGS